MLYFVQVFLCALKTQLQLENYQEEFYVKVNKADVPNQHGEREYFMLTQGQDNEIDPTFLLFRKHTKKDKHLKVRIQVKRRSTRDTILDYSHYISFEAGAQRFDVQSEVNDDLVSMMEATIEVQVEIHKDWKLQKRERRSLRDSTGLTDDEIETLRVAFVREDADRDRTLDQEEFRTLVALEIGNIEENLIDLLFRKMDDNGDGRISFFEFSLAISILGGGTPEEKLRYMFDVFDVDGNGRIEDEEAFELVGQLLVVAQKVAPTLESAESFVDGIISKLDSNNDDSIDLEEWIEVGLRTPSVLTLLGSGNFDLFSESHRDAQHYEVELV